MNFESDVWRGDSASTSFTSDVEGRDRGHQNQSKQKWPKGCGEVKHLRQRYVVESYASESLQISSVC